MQRLALLLAVVAVPIVSHAETKNIAALLPSGHAVPQHTEVCVAATEEDIAALFDRWNASLQTGDVHKVSANYAPTSLLLPTVSSRPRITVQDKEDYFQHFLENQPVGRIDALDSREIEIDCNTAIDAGLYTFTFKKTGASVKARYTFTYKWDGKQWLITSHHSSALPTADAPPEHVHQAVPQHTEVCVAATEEDIAALFDRWNTSLQTGDVHKVSANYAPTSLLLPTVSSRPRRTALDKEDYFHHFLENHPVGRIDSREIEIDCNTAIDTGLYTFTFKKTGASVKARYTFTYKWDGKQWLITSHHSSALPTADAPPEHVHQAVPQHTEVCVAATEEDIAALFDRWNTSLQTGDVHKVSANYAPTSLLLPTVSSRPRRTALDKEDYFHHFLENHPVGRIDSIDSREIEIDCNTAIDAGFYTFTFKKTGASVKARYTFTYKWDGNQWLITSHHSSAIPPKE